MMSNGRFVKKSDCPITHVLIDGLVILKIIKHCHEEGNTVGEAQGHLLGLVSKEHLEVTNCFPFPRFAEEEEFNDEEYQDLMLKHFRQINVDHLMVGWYQSNPGGSALNKVDTVDSQLTYQNQIKESVVLHYDPSRTARGFLALKAYRLTAAAMKLRAEKVFTLESLRNNKASFDRFFETVPIKIHNSHLIRGLMLELDSEIEVDQGNELFDLGGVSMLERHLQSLMKCVEDVSRWAGYQRQLLMKQQQIQKENAARVFRGEPPLSEEEIQKMIKPVSSQQRYEAFLNYCQTLNYCQQASAFSAQNVGKLFLSKALQEGNDSESCSN